ncbi:MAG: DUF975 family protein [Oscillospiraceae bacterium]|jgi:hypothetical protein|nr:DUF975 family protein [Oscillospiraceae bacterium]
MIKYGVRLSLVGRIMRTFLACTLPMLLPWLLRLSPIQLFDGRFDLTLLIYGQQGLVISGPMTLISFIAAALVTDPMAVRLAGYFITLHRDPENLPSPLSICDCFGAGYGRLVGGMLLSGVTAGAAALLPLLLGALVPGLLTWVTVDGTRALLVSEPYTAFVLLSLLMGLLARMRLLMVPYVLADRPDLSAMEAFRRSLYLTRQRLWELVVLQLSFFGWLMLASITMLIGLIYVYPYLEGTMAAYYLAFAEPLPYETDPNPPPPPAVPDDAAG